MALSGLVCGGVGITRTDSGCGKLCVCVFSLCVNFVEVVC